jgi:hypothetical protein
MTMDRLTAILMRFLRGAGWREIATAPFDREIEIAVINDNVPVLGGSRVRHGDGWLDAETLKPVAVTATHWRYRRPAMLPMSCC